MNEYLQDFDREKYYRQKAIESITSGIEGVYDLIDRMLMEDFEFVENNVGFDLLCSPDWSPKLEVEYQKGIGYLISAVEQFSLVSAALEQAQEKEG